MNKTRVMFGPKAIEFSLSGCWDYPSISMSELEKLWDVIGPTIDMNQDKIPVWALCTLCYAQGLENGYSLKESKKNESKNIKNDTGDEQDQGNNKRNQLAKWALQFDLE